MSTTVVVPAFNRSELTIRCLESLVADDAMRTVPIVVVDDGSSDETAKQLAARFGERVAVRRLNENKGFATACNFAADFVDTEWTVFLNNDTVAFPGWLDNMFAYQRQHPSAAALGARLLYPDGTAQHAGVVFGSDSLPYHAYHGFPGEHPAVMQSRRLQAVTGACLLIRTDLFRDIGGFDAAYRNGYEDIDLCLRVAGTGAEVHYCHQAVLVHDESATRGFTSPNDKANLELFLQRWAHTVVRDDLTLAEADGVLKVQKRWPFRVFTEGHETVDTSLNGVAIRDSPVPVRVAVVGSSDLENYGDVLFPFVAQAELSRRLGDVEVVAHGLTAKDTADWPCSVRPVESLFDTAPSFDGLLVGGGELVRFDECAPSYASKDGDVHQRVGLWLLPTVIAQAAGVPTVYNAVGVFGDIPGESAVFVNRILKGVNRLAVRDEPSRQNLRRTFGGSISVVPDTAFGLRDVYAADQLCITWDRLSEEFGLKPGCVFVQAHAFVDEFAQKILTDPAFAEKRLVVVPVGPVLGDHPGCIGESVSAIRIDRFLEPIEMVALISRSAAVVGLSLHAAITALVHHVPVVRPIDYWIPKYSALTSFVSVLSYRNDALPTAQAVLRHIESFNEADVAVLSQRSALLAVHWDKVAALLVRRDGAVRALPWGNGTSRLLAEAISRGLGETTSQDHRIAEQSSHIKLLTERVEELQSQLAAQHAQRAQIEYDRLHHRTMFDAVTTSTSWKVTEPMRKIGRKLGRNGQSPDFSIGALPAVVGGAGRGLVDVVLRRHPVLRFDRLAAAEMRTIPYSWGLTSELFHKHTAHLLADEYPTDGFKTMLGADTEKSWSYEVRPLVSMGGATATGGQLSPAWTRFVDDIVSTQYRDAISDVTGVDVRNLPLEANAFHYPEGSWLGPHTDLAAKVVTHVLYFNQEWQPSWGGGLRILRTSEIDDIDTRINPEVGGSVVFVRSDNSWHAVESIGRSAPTSRRSVVVTFYLPGSPSTMWPTDETPDLHRFPR